ncbi:MAG: hypothetical protein OEY14_12525, partial [Myxococcales bacterium]|nr:hypothetical protein [Myxococcales bacterium]
MRFLTFAWLVGALALGGLIQHVSATRAEAQGWGLTRPPSKQGPSGRGGRRGGRRGERPPRGRQPAGADRSATLIARYRAVLEHDPRETFAFGRLLDLYRARDGNVDAFVRELEEAARADAQAYVPRMLLGHVHRARSEIAEARRLYEEAIALRPREPTPRLALALVERGSGQLEPARASYEAALPLIRADADRQQVLRTLGELCLEMGEHDAARAYFDRVARGASGS